MGGPSTLLTCDSLIHLAGLYRSVSRDKIAFLAIIISLTLPYYSKLESTLPNFSKGIKVITLFLRSSEFQRNSFKKFNILKKIFLLKNCDFEVLNFL